MNDPDEYYLNLSRFTAGWFCSLQITMSLLETASDLLNGWKSRKITDIITRITKSFFIRSGGTTARIPRVRHKNIYHIDPKVENFRHLMKKRKQQSSYSIKHIGPVRLSFPHHNRLTGIDWETPRGGSTACRIVFKPWGLWVYGQWTHCSQGGLKGNFIQTVSIRVWSLDLSEVGLSRTDMASSGPAGKDNCHGRNDMYSCPGINPGSTFYKSLEGAPLLCDQRNQDQAGMDHQPRLQDGGLYLPEWIRTIELDHQGYISWKTQMDHADQGWGRHHSVWCRRSRIQGQLPGETRVRESLLLLPNCNGKWEYGLDKPYLCGGKASRSSIVGPLGNFTKYQLGILYLWLGLYCL